MAREKRIALKVLLDSIWRVLNMPVSDLEGKTMGQVLIESAKEGFRAWLQVEGNYERLAPWAQDMIEDMVASAEAARLAAQQTP